jgi:hypothetical protein
VDVALALCLVVESYGFQYIRKINFINLEKPFLSTSVYA